MKEVLSLFTFGIGRIVVRCVHCRLKPDVVIAVTGPGKSGYCSTKASPVLACRSQLFAAALWPNVVQR
jgi:hypothetical protein